MKKKRKARVIWMIMANGIYDIVYHTAPSVKGLNEYKKRGHEVVKFREVM